MAAPSKRAFKRVLSGSPVNEKEDETNWEGHLEYMTIKRKKLREQIDSLGQRKSDIFEGVTIYVNGHTNPNSDELKELIYFHGGLYDYALSSKTTHVIATNLPTAKIRNLSETTIVCKPDWIVDSIKNSERLPVDEYLLYRTPNNQKKIGFGKDSEIGSKVMNAVPPKHEAAVKEGGTGSEEFVKEFYAHSRLHYLSTWSKELKEFTNRVLPVAKQCIPRLNRDESLRGRGTRAVVHVDVDCFFVSVGILDKPHLKGKPVAVTHAKHNPSKQLDKESMSDIASCSYEAREFGVKNGMFVSKALSMCPQLVLIPYEFDKYRSVSQALYEILISFSHLVEPVSCDEAYIELTDYVRDQSDVNEIIKSLRRDVFDKTGCNVSAGASHNMLLARLATRRAKPNGQWYLTEGSVQQYLAEQPVGSLPGVGRGLTGKISDTYGIHTCGELKSVPLDVLKERHGVKTGEMLYNYSRGVDNRQLKLNSVRKSMSVDINFGIRFKKLSEAEDLLQQLGKEMETRLVEEGGLKGECLCLKLKIRKPSAPTDTKKYLGHGPCNNVSRSYNSLSLLQSGAEIGKIACRLLKQTKVVVSDIRGVGIQLTKLQGSTSSPSIQSPSSIQSPLKQDIRSLMTSGRNNTGGSSAAELGECSYIPPPSSSSSITASAIHQSLPEKLPGEFPAESPNDINNDCIYNLPPIDDLDQSVLLQLPPDIQEKIFDEYSRKSLQISSSDSTATSHNKTYADERSTTEDKATQENAFHTRAKITSKTQDAYVTELRSNIKKWVAESGASGPNQTQIGSFLSHLEWLTGENIEVVYLALSCLKRVIVSRQPSNKEWISLFNDSLALVQSKLQSLRHFQPLDITCIVCE